MKLFGSAIRRDSVSLKRFLFCLHVQGFSCKMTPVCRFKYPYSCFSLHLYFQEIVVYFVLTLSVLLLAAVISLYLLLLMWSSSPHFNASSLSLMLLLYLTHSNCQCHLSDERPCTSSLVFLSFGSVFWVPTLSISRMVMIILRERQPCVYSFDQISVAEVGFKKFSCFSKVLFLYFFFNLCLFDGVYFNICKYL